MPRSPEHNLVQFLVTMAIVIVVAIFNWLKKRNQSEEPSDTGSEREFTPPPQPRRPRAPSTAPPIAPRRPARQTNWAEELRRMVEGREPVAEPAREEPRHASVPPVLS